MGHEVAYYESSAPSEGGVIEALARPPDSKGKRDSSATGTSEEACIFSVTGHRSTRSQLPLNCCDASFRSFEKAGARVVDAASADWDEGMGGEGGVEEESGHGMPALAYAMSPVATTVCGVVHGVLTPGVRIARFAPLASDDAVTESRVATWRQTDDSG